MSPLSARNKRWQLRAPPPTGYTAPAGSSDIVAALLYQRIYQAEAAVQGASPEAAVDAFLESSYSTGLHNPFSMKGMEKAAERIAQAIAAREPMAVYGDFDTDGVTAVALLMQAIPALGGHIRPYIPHRHNEGYGLNTEAIETLAAEGVRLLITVDCGISNAAEVQHANQLGLDVIITDHHRPPPELPPAYAVVNPKQPDCTYPYDQLVGVGIAYKLVQALVKKGLHLHNLRGRDMLDVVALGTVADMGPLLGENRVLVKAGLEALRDTQRPGLRALMQVAGLTPAQVDSTAIGFMLGPRLNAAGRLDDAIRAYELLLTDDFATAQRLAEELNQANRQRQTLTKQVMEEASAEAEASGKHQGRIVVLNSEHYPSGIVGLVAGKLVERWGRPVILIARGEEDSRGSARSISTFNIFQALSTCAELFVRFGGHSMAAGFTIANEHLPELEARLAALAEEQLTDEMLQPTLYIDGEIELERLDWALLRDLERLEPFGQANQQPLFVSRGVYVLDARAIGKDQSHLKLRVGTSSRAPGQGKGLEAIAFGLGRMAEPLRKHPCIDIAYTLEANTWNGTQSLQLNVKDFRRVQ
jgi:single-stranded-DNA-specific exonuclease